MRSLRTMSLALAALVAAAPSTAVRADPSPAVNAVLDAGRDPALSRPDLRAELEALRALYATEPGLFWFEGASPRPAVAGCLETLSRAASSGLDPADYDGAPLAARVRSVGSAPGPAPAEIAQLDVALTAAFMRLLQDVHQGRVDPRSMGFDYDVGNKRLDLPAVLRSARDREGCAAAFAAAEPPFHLYGRLVRTLADYRALAARGEPPLVPSLAPPRKKIEPGGSWAGVTPLLARLRALGELPGGAAAPEAAPDGLPRYTGEVVEAVKRFQDRHALEPDGVIGPGTVGALNTPLALRVRQIELALERLRWLPHLPDRPTIVVNVPLFLLFAIDPDRQDDPLRMRVVTGKSAGHETPLFIDQMEYVVFRPYWNPPPSIVRTEIVPHARRDATYFDRQDMEIVASGEDDAPALPATPENLERVASGKLHVRQRPGPKNSLGLAKFIFPNANNVYMHGTPAKQLFSRARRDYSHGCIRVEDPPRLAEWVLRANPDWTRERILEAMGGERPARVDLKDRVTVVIFYDTVSVDSSGVVHFADDYYRHDARLEKALRRGG